MRRAMVMMSCCLSLAGQAFAQDDRGADERAVRDVVQRYVDARDRRDATALAQLFTPDADQFTTTGEWRRGRDAIVKGGLASSQRNPGNRTITVESVRFLSSDVAIADGGYAIAASSGAGPRMWTTLILVRGREGWRIAGIRNARPVEQ